MEEFLFIGGVYDGQVWGVPSGAKTWTVAVIEPFIVPDGATHIALTDPRIQTITYVKQPLYVRPNKNEYVFVEKGLGRSEMIKRLIAGYAPPEETEHDEA